MRLHLPLFATLAAFLALPTAFVPRVSAEPLRLVAADEHGVTLHLEGPEFKLGPPGAGGIVTLEAPGLESVSLAGRPQLPLAVTLIAVPPRARVTARVIGDQGEDLTEGVRLPIGMEPGFRGDGGRLGAVPTLEVVPAKLDGPWPVSPVEVSEPFTVRRQWVVSVQVYPFRYDAASSRLWARRGLTVRLDFASVPPLRGELGAGEDEGHWEPVLRGSVLNYEQGRHWRESRVRGGLEPEHLFPGRSGGFGAEGAAAFDESETEVRVRLDSTGVYALDFDELRSHNYPLGVPDSEVSVHRHEYIQDSPPPAPPYATIEVPIEVEDRDHDGRFGPGDRIVLFVQSWAERSRASIAQRAWGDAEVVYVTRLRGRTGLRIPSRPGWLSLSLPPLVSYPWTQRWEQNDFYMPVFQPTVTDTNTDQFLWVPSGASLVQLYAVPDSFAFEANDLDTSHTVRFAVTWQGTRANGHLNWAKIRNGSNQLTSVVDSTSWSGRGSITRTATLRGSALSEGDRNVLRAWGRTDPCPDPIDCQRVFAVINYFQATYWRRFNALNGYLPCNSAGAAGNYAIEASGFGTRDIRVYDVRDSLRPVRLALDDSHILGSASPISIEFQDSIASAATRNYVVFDTPKTVPADQYSDVTRRSLTNRSAGDYLLIVPEAFQDAVGPLKALRESQHLNVVLAPLESVNDEFNGGRRSSYAIKRFIRYAYRNWNAQFVLLVGDGSDDPQHFVSNLPDWIPVQKILGPVGISDFSSSIDEAIPSDPWYVWCVDCPNPGLQPKIHDLYIGRLPVNSLQQTKDVVDKIVAYESVSPDQIWRREMVLLADDTYSTESFFGGGNPGDPTYCHRYYEAMFLGISHKIRELILNEAGLSRTSPFVFNLEWELRNEPPDPNRADCRESWPGTQQSTRLSVTPKLKQLLSAGKLWWNFQGHANPSVLTHEDLYVNRGSNDDKDDLMNEGKPFFFSAFSCHPNQFSRIQEANPNIGPSLGEDMVLLPKSGAVASWASTGYEVLPSDSLSHINLDLARALFAQPRYDDTTRRYWDGRVVLGEAIARALLDNLRRRPSFQEQDVGISYTLLGDPATRISIGSPGIVVKANGQDVTDGEPVRLSTLTDTLRLDADIASNVSLKSISLEKLIDATGTRDTIPDSEYTLTPAFPDTARSGTGGRRYHLSHFTRLEVGSYRYMIGTVDTNGVPGHFDVVFKFLAILRAGGEPLIDRDKVSPNANLTLTVISPRPIDNPQTEFGLTLFGPGMANGVPQPYTPTRQDPSGREWQLSWTHQPYPLGEYRLELTVAGLFTITTRFLVGTRMALENAFAFPNPFDDELGTHFSFYLTSDGPADVLLRVFTVSGRLVYDQAERLSPGYHQIAWDGREVANGIYLFRLLARNPSGSTMHEGRLVKLRKPVRHSTEGE